MNKLILVFACAFSTCVKPPEHVSVSDKSVEVYAESIVTPSIKVLSIGGFYFKDKVEKLYLDLEYKGVLSSDQAQGQIVAYVTGMLQHINQDKVLSPFLIKEMFDLNDVSVSLAYSSEGGVSSQVHVEDGNIIFSTYEKSTNSLKQNKALPFINIP